MNSDNQARTGGFVMESDEGQAFWFLNTLTINKVGSDDTEGRLSIVDHRVPAGFAPPPHIHQASDEAFLVLDGQFEGFCGDQEWRAGPGSLVYLPHGIAHGFTVSVAGPAGSSWSYRRADSTSSSRPRASLPRPCGCPSPSRPTRPSSPSSPPRTASRSSPRPSPSTQADDQRQAGVVPALFSHVVTTRRASRTGKDELPRRRRPGPQAAARSRAAVLRAAVLRTAVPPAAVPPVAARARHRTVPGGGPGWWRSR